MVNDPKDCCVLVPVGSYVEPQCERGLIELEKAGYEVRRVYGYSQIDVARNAIASDALRDGFQETLWIDSDIDFLPADVLRLREHDLPICCGLYPKKGRRELACHVAPGTKGIQFGQTSGGLMTIKYAGTGFLHVRREVYESIQKNCNLPVCNAQFGSPIVPYFMPQVVETEAGPWYVGEDYAFCERARLCGYEIQADTRIRLRHIGKYAYSWEDAGTEIQRFADYSLGFDSEQ